MSDIPATPPAGPTGAAARTRRARPVAPERRRPAGGTPGGAGQGHAAARRVKAEESVAVTVPVLGKVRLPPPQQLAYLAGIGALAALEIIEWPAALVLAVGHALVTQQHNRVVQELGEALDEVV